MKYRPFLALPIAAACLVFLGPNFVQARAMTSATPFAATLAPITGQHEANLMVPARADLVKTLKAKDIRVGQTFEARLNKTIFLKNGPKLRYGTILIGKVVKDNMKTKGRTSTLALRFTKAKMRNGETIPIKATIVGLYPPRDGIRESFLIGPMPNYWTPQTLQVEQIHALHRANLYSRIAGRNSGVLRSRKNDNMKIGDGSEFALALAEHHGNQQKLMNRMEGRGEKTGA